MYWIESEPGLYYFYISYQILLPNMYFRSERDSISSFLPLIVCWDNGDLSAVMGGFRRQAK